MDDAKFDSNECFYSMVRKVKPEYPRSKYERYFNDLVMPIINWSSKYPLVIFEEENENTRVIGEREHCSMMDLPLLHRRPKAYMTFRLKDNIVLGQIVVELFSDYCPKTVENFLALCNSSNPRMMYRNCKIYNAFRDKYFETGDVTKNSGKGGCSIFGEKFKEDHVILKHCRKGILSMASDDAWNDSRFGISFKALPELDGSRVVFGQVIRGGQTISKINDMSRTLGGPMVTILITKCGQVPDSEYDSRYMTNSDWDGFYSNSSLTLNACTLSEKLSETSNCIQ